MDFWRPEIVAPIAGIAMVIAIVLISSLRKLREKELQAHQELRTREMEHERKLKELEIEKARIELEKARLGKNG